MSAGGLGDGGGQPVNYEHSVTVGVVSAKDRKIDENL
jgi:hypothetical protein